MRSYGFSVLGQDENQTKLATDRDESTTMFVEGDRIIIDLGVERTVSSFHFVPDQGEPNKGLISNYELAVGLSEDGINNVVKSGEFSNIKNNPVLQSVHFTPVQARFISLKATRMIAEGEPMGFAEIAIR